MVDLNRFHPRAGLTAAVSLLFVAAGCIVLAVLEDRTARVIAAAALFAAAFGITVFLTRRARRIEAAQREEIERAEARYRTLMDSLPLVTWLTEPGDGFARRSSLARAAANFGIVIQSSGREAPGKQRSVSGSAVLISGSGIGEPSPSPLRCRVIQPYIASRMDLP